MVKRDAERKIRKRVKEGNERGVYEVRKDSVEERK